MSSALTTSFEVHRCVFCDINNPSWKKRCEKCGAVTIPTRDQNSEELKWTKFAFGPAVPIPLGPHTQTYFDQEYPAVLGPQSRAAIFVGNSEHKVLVIIEPGEEVAFSTQTGVQRPATMTWDLVTEAELSQAVQQIIPGQTDYASIIANAHYHPPQP
ncbi:hypothetical protein H2204_008730 [Knufia peltigerae]|uniref:Uncharacterized protein n=1 Tax=Knufia peltigerae TaxID=1002370 RepID=A0AA38XZC6_9EURO|nr:hypothetical protein H2204_008730 [Knufia peltigerae]